MPRKNQRSKRPAPETIKLIMNRYTLIFLLAFLLAFFQTSKANEIYKNFEASYSLEFSGMTVAKGILHGRFDNKTKTYKIHLEGATTSFISIFYSLKEIIEGSVGTSKQNEIKNEFYKSIEKRPKKTKIVYATFPDKKTAKVLIVKNKDKKTYILKSEKGVFSPISLYVFFMANPITIGKTYYRDVVVTKHLYRVAISVIKKTTINLDKFRRKRGKRKTLEVELRFYKIEKNGKISKYKKVKKVVAWISTTPPLIPILVKSWNFIGFFSARLTSLKLMTD